eukprot:6212223-Pleurochrysis_carterae.AAC.2
MNVSRPRILCATSDITSSLAIPRGGGCEHYSCAACVLSLYSSATDSVVVLCHRFTRNLAPSAHIRCPNLCARMLLPDILARAAWTSTRSALFERVKQQTRQGDCTHRAVYNRTQIVLKSIMQEPFS